MRYWLLCYKNASEFPRLCGNESRIKSIGVSDTVHYSMKYMQSHHILSHPIPSHVPNLLLSRRVVVLSLLRSLLLEVLNVLVVVVNVLLIGGNVRLR
jgi:hypothetical protein